MKITSHLLAAFLKCPTKCYLRSLGEAGTGNQYAHWVKTQTELYHAEGVERLCREAPQDEWVASPSLEDLKAAKWRLAVNVAARTEDMEAQIHAVERVPTVGRGKSAQFVPIRFVPNNKLLRDEKLLMAFDAVVLSEVLGREIAAGKIIHAKGYAIHKVNTALLGGQVRKLAEKVTALVSSKMPPDLVLNGHCRECEFRDRCHQRAVETDDLSLLSSMNERERQKNNRRGIFTVTQLSYTFRPRRRPKRLRERREKYHHALKALAIRAKKIHVVGSPLLTIEGTPVYLDVEGFPDADLYYLIGLRFQTTEGNVRHSLWADNAEAEKQIWADFLRLLAGIKQPVLFHYGNYETIFLKKMCKRYGGPLQDSPAAKAITATVN